MRVGMRLYVTSSKLCPDIPGTVVELTEHTVSVRFDNGYCGNYGRENNTFEEIK